MAQGIDTAAIESALTPAALFASLVIGAVGSALVLYAKKQGRIPQGVTGALLIIFPFFVVSAIWQWLIASVLIAALWCVVRLGY